MTNIYENDTRWVKAMKGLEDLHDLYIFEHSLAYSMGYDPDRVRSVVELKHNYEEAKINVKRLEERIRRERVKEAEKLIKEAFRDLY